MKDTDTCRELLELGVHVPTILLPRKGTDMTKWSVVACDQYTSQPEYWDEVEKLVGESPSTLRLILPEVYLNAPGSSEKIDKINSTMKEYIENGILIPENPGFIYVERQTSHSPLRRGLITAVDLECYDYVKGSCALIRATEGTVIDRLPPRIKIREHAPIELPHIMLLIDDPEGTVIEPLSALAKAQQPLYDFDLMMKGMHIKGYKIDSSEAVSGILSALKKLSSPEVFASKYRIPADSKVMLFAVGDGNHSLASAKAHWENVKKTLSTEEAQNHPSRYALVEVVNVHDSGLAFEPIHRVLFNVKPAEVIGKMLDYFKGIECKADWKACESIETAIEYSKKSKDSMYHLIPFISSSLCGVLKVESPCFNLEVATLQAFIDHLLNNDSSTKIDYIHGDDVVASLGSKPGNMGFYLPPMDKCELFRTVILDGVLPRKTFSMGEAEEKRFYLECRKISDSL